MVNPHIFRQYDIRGVVGRDLTPELGEWIGHGFGTVLQRRRAGETGLRVALGRDNRLSSNDLAAGVRRGLVRAGIHVVDVGTVPTPALSFAAAYLGTDGAIQVTGSHNPPEYNGFKMTIGGRSLYGDQIQEVRSIIDAEDYVSGEGRVEEVDILPTYVKEVSAKFDIQRPVKVVIDCGNGTGSLVAEELLHALGSNVDVVPIFCESDGTFPNHHPDPVVDKNLVDLIAKVKETKADFGVAFDGDADRIGAVDDQGRIVRGDTLLLIYGLDLIERNGPGRKVVFDVKCSQALTEMLDRVGGVPIMSATGHSLIKERMKKEHALLAGELSGHIMFAENYYGFDDAMYAACLLLSIVARKQEPPLLLARHLSPLRLHLRDPLPGVGGEQVRDRGAGSGALLARPRGDLGGRRAGTVRRWLGAHPRLQHGARARRALRGEDGGTAEGDPRRDGGMAARRGRRGVAGIHY
jgi:phosphomannomutase/phosphoglucomutase